MKEGNVMNHVRRWLIFIVTIITILAEVFIKANESIPMAKMNYYLYILIFVGLIALTLAVISYFVKKVRDKLEYKSYFWSGVILFIGVLNLLTAKFNILPTIYFPSPSRVIGVIVEDRVLILKCLAYSSRLLSVGFFGGALVGIFSGIAIGFSKKAAYWLNPIVKFLGPIPSTAWIPLVLVVFPGTVSASSFLIALAVWFPATLMTSSGIQNVKKSFFEVSETLGANTFYKIFKVALPAAMPSIFIGIFNGLCSAFITLMTAEMIGAKYGIGWYVNWQKEMMCYSNVYAGLIVIAVTFSILITILFKIKDRLLVWQKGVIKW